MVVIATAALVQGVVGIGMNVFSVPLLLLIDPILAPVPNLLLALPLVAFQVRREHESVDRAGVRWILIGRLPGGVAGLGLLFVLSEAALNLTIALLILVIVALLASGVSIARNPATELVAGTFSGIAGIVGAAGGPPVGLLYRDAPAAVVRSTVGVVFAVGLVISIGLRAAGGQMSASDVEVALWLLPAMTLGFVISTRVKDKVNGEWVRRGILIVSSIASITLLVRTLLTG
jgi:uncharacterized membrane protein YfcA